MAFARNIVDENITLECGKALGRDFDRYRKDRDILLLQARVELIGLVDVALQLVLRSM